jgi:hypothetical protein
MEMHECGSCETCSASICPLDPSKESRVWYIGEEVCKGRSGSGRRYIKKQRSYNKRKPKSYMGKPLSYQMLYDNSRPRVMTDEQRAELQERGKKLALLRHKAKISAGVTVAVGAN